ncbi:HAD-IA family hydrolase [Pontivivens ytuae]|uniref:HAD-IA family hydrolase n=1 Tax=Pontivivens ytuae TaxID=2789856 RepID=A0A7S9LTR4_9RHOB|nr:HAD-IA family hydrolase [Pontivivens ytuae]QPH55018.1 HAD-IA family hydrolase [Pontivivens ytuae]
MDALFFGSIGTVAETSEMQRRAFNAAFAEDGLDWDWGRELYQDMLTRSGGADRIRRYADQHGPDLDDERIARLHARKTEIFDKEMQETGLTPRPGVRRLLTEARKEKLPVAFVTATGKENVDALLTATSGILRPDDFDLIVTREMIEEGKPAPDAYNLALERLNVSHPLAIEDNAQGVSAAVAAGIPCIATPGANTTGEDYSDAVAVLPHLGDGEHKLPDVELCKGYVTLAWLHRLTGD